MARRWAPRPMSLRLLKRMGAGGAGAAGAEGGARGAAAGAPRSEHCFFDADSPFMAVMTGKGLAAVKAGFQCRMIWPTLTLMPRMPAQEVWCRVPAAAPAPERRRPGQAQRSS